ncbi:MAG TPA: anti-sigma factor [Burkholderiales bacterium]|nr:anti-sigma factor [Burkholderiales bacterium]
MQYRNKAELQDKLAAEYVLGTLRGRARLRFHAWMRDDAALRTRVSEWEERLAPMHEAIAEVKPPKRVWQTIQARIARPATTTEGGFWSSLAFWRNWGLLVSGFAAALIVTIAAKPMMFNLQDADEMARQMQPSYVAALHATGSQSDELVFMAYAARQSNQLWVKKVALKEAPAAHSYELWGLPAKSGESPKSLGIIPASAKGTMQLVAVADKSLSEFPQLAISVEPAGGSKTGVPTGPVIAKGNCFKFW